MGEALSVEDVRFEWVPPGNLLGEIDGDKPVGNEPATAVDVVLWCRLRDGGKGAVLLEVKLSETDFTHCKGRTSRANKRKDVCGSAELFFKKSKNCYLQRPRHQKRDRRYWEIFAKANMAASGRHFPAPTSMGHARLRRACSSRCAISL